MSVSARLPHSLLFTLVSVIQWSFRWYLLAALLLVWAALGAWTLIRKKEEKKEYKTSRIVFKAIAMLLLVVIAVTPALIFPQYKLPKMTGKHEVATVNYTYTDKSRIETFTNTGENRKVNVEFWYPKDAGGTYPLVVFSHGTAGQKPATHRPLWSWRATATWSARLTIPITPCSPSTPTAIAQ